MARQGLRMTMACALCVSAWTVTYVFEIALSNTKTYIKGAEFSEWLDLK